MQFQYDNIYAKPHNPVSAFTFDERVADVFPDMVIRSVPGYHTILQHIGLFASRFAQPFTNIYDLGCSLGAVTLAIRHSVTVTDVSIFAVDNSKPMVNRCKNICEQDTATIPVTVICDNIENIVINRASVVVMNFTLQFIDPKDRQILINKIYDGMISGGVLIISEKLQLDAKRDDFISDLHHDFKHFNGYNDLEISQKREALENVLVRQSEDVHLARFKKSGFDRVEKWFSCLNFASFLAIK